jgi:selenoprotein W-related protein
MGLGPQPPAVTDVEIEYCVPCGFRERAVDVAGAILAAREDDLEGLRLETGDHGVFEVRVDGETVYDKEESAFDVDRIVRDVRAAV